MTVRAPTPAAPAPPAAPAWVAPLAGIAAAVIVGFLCRTDELRPLAAPWALVGHALSAGVLAAMLAETVALVRRRAWAVEAVQACLDQVRATPSLTDRHEIFHLHRELWQARIGGRLFLYFLAAAPAALAGLLAVLARMPEPGAPLAPAELFLPLTVATVETLIACLAVSLVWRGWSVALARWEAQALTEYQPVNRPGAAAWDTPPLPPPVQSSNGPIPFGQLWGAPSEPSRKSEPVPEERAEPGPDYGR